MGERKRKAGNWLKGFQFWTSESECPDSYLFWTGMSILSSAIQRRLYTRWVYGKYYPNSFVILVGPAGETHKSSAIWFAKDLLSVVGVPVASDAITREALIQQMKNRPGTSGNQALAVLAGEFDTFIDASGPRMIMFLTDIYDSEDNWEYTTKGGGTDHIKSPYLTLLGGIVPNWIGNHFDDTFIEGGFVARTFFVVEEVRRFKNPRPEVTKEMWDMREALAKDLAHISTLEGELKWTDAAKEWFDNWYLNIWNTESLDYRLKSYGTRKPTHIVRTAQIVSISESDVLELDQHHFEVALAQLENLEQNMVKAFSSVGKNPIASDLERIAMDIAREGGMTLSEIHRRNTHALNRQQLDETISNLCLMGVIEKDPAGGPTRYIPTVEEK